MPRILDGRSSVSPATTRTTQTTPSTTATTKAGDGERSDLYVRENGALSFPDSKKLSSEEKLERAQRLLEVLRTKQESKLTFGGRVSLAGIDGAASLRNYYGALKVAAAIAEHDVDVSAVAEFAKTVPMPADLRKLAFAAAGVEGSVKPESAKKLGDFANAANPHNVFAQGFSGNIAYFAVPDELVKQLPQAGWPLDLNGALQRASQPLRADVGIGAARLFARAAELNVGGIGVSDWNALAKALPNSEEAASVLARLAKALHKNFDEIEFHGAKLSDARPPRRDDSARRVVGALGGEDLDQAAASNALTYGDPRFTRQSDASLRRTWSTPVDFASFVNVNGSPSFKSGLLFMFARAKELGLPVTANVGNVQQLLNVLPFSQENIDGARRLARAFGLHESALQLKTDASGKTTTTLDKFPPTKGLPPRRLAQGEPLGTLHASVDKVVEMRANKDPAIFTIDDTSLVAAANHWSEITAGYVVAAENLGDVEWMRNAFRLWERAIELQPNAIGANTTGNPGTGKLGDFVRQKLNNPALSDPAAMEALARVFVRAGIDPATTNLTSASGVNLMLTNNFQPDSKSVFAHAYDKAKRALLAETSAPPTRRAAKKLWADGPLGGEQFRDKGARDWGYANRDQRFFQMDDDSLRAFGAFDINSWAYHFGSAKVFSFVARCAELQGAPANWNQFTNYIQNFLRNPIAAQFASDDAIPHIARMAAAGNVPFANVTLQTQAGTIKLADHPILRGTDPASTTARTNAIRADLAALDPALTPEADESRRVDALTSMFGANNAHEVSELLPALLKARLDGTLAPTALSGKSAADVGALAAQLGHIGAAAVLLGLTTRMSRGDVESALAPLAASKAQAAQWADATIALSKLSGAELTFALADVARDPSRPDFSTLAQRLEIGGAHIDGKAIAARFDASGKLDPGAFARVMVERAFLAPAGSDERNAVIGALGSLVETGKLSGRSDVAPAMSEAARGEVERDVLSGLDDVVAKYLKHDVPIDAVVGAFDKASAFVEPKKVVEHLLARILQTDLAREIPLDVADQELGGVEGVSGERTSPFPSGTKTVTLGGVELATNIDATKDVRAVPRAANADLVMTTTTERNLRLIAGSWRKKRPVLLEGPTSAGKTAIVRYIAHKVGSPYRRINMSYFTDVSDLVGRYVGGEKRFDSATLDAKSDSELKALAEEYGIEAGGDVKKEILAAQAKPRWVDGPIVKAMKKGEVLLLDEINLARNEVIERLNSLFDDDGNLVLTEHNNEVIKQHDNFRIFATMNPASYAGRTRLSEAMRSRWNNVFAHGLTQADVKTILKAKYTDKIPDVELAKLIAVHDNLARLADEGAIGRKTGGIAFSLRNVFRVADRFVRYQGGDLSDDALMRRETEEIYRGGLFDPEDLSAVDDILATAMPYSGPGFYDHLELKEDGDTFTIGDVVVSKLNTGHQMVPPAKSRLIMTGRTKQAMYRLAKALDMGENVALVGERAAGKTALTKMYAHLRGQPYYRQLFTAGTDGMQLVGGYDHLGWKDGLLLTAGRPENVPGIYLADEFNVGSAAAQERFNSVLDDERKVVLAEKEGEEIRLNKDYRFVAAMNPPTQAYGGREKLSKAMQNRLTVIWVPDLKEKNELLEVALGRAKQMGVQPAIAEALVELHTWVVDAYQEGLLGKDVRERDRPVYSIRQLMAALEMVAEFQGEKGPADAYLYAVETCYASSGEAVEDSAVIVDKAKEIGE